MMAEWDKRYPGRTESVLTAIQNVVPSHLGDRNLFDFEGLRAETAGEIVGGGDIAFDAESFDEPCATPEGAEGGLTDQPQVITFR